MVIKRAFIYSFFTGRQARKALSLPPPPFFFFSSQQHIYSAIFPFYPFKGKKQDLLLYILFLPIGCLYSIISIYIYVIKAKKKKKKK